MIIDVRKLLKYNNTQLKEMLTGEFKIKVDDGIVNTNYREVIVNSYFWNFHRSYPNTPLLLKHVLFTENKNINNGIISKHIETIYWDVVNVYSLDDPYKRESLNKFAYQTVSDFYNDLISFAKEYVTTIDITDFCEIYDHPKINEQLENLTYETKNFNAIYSVYADLLKNDSYFNNNNVAIAVRSGSVNQNQVNQCIGPRGIVSEIDLSILKRPVLSGFAKGMQTIYDGLGEGRTAAKSLYFNSAKIGDTEYKARRIQILAMVVERLYHKVDCGSTRYVEWEIQPPHITEDGSKWKGDLEYMDGKYYYDDESKQLKMLRKDDTHLYGKKLKIRTAIFCKHDDPHGVCEICFGGLSNNLNPSSQLGHYCAATMSQQQTQSILSTKHLDSSGNSTTMALNGNAAKYFHTYDNLRVQIKTNDIKIYIPREIFASIIDIEVVDNIENLNNRSIAEIEAFMVENSEASIERISLGSKIKVMFTYEMLEYIKDNYTTRIQLDEDFVIIDMEDFHLSNNVFEVIQKQYSYSDHAKDISKIIESRMTELLERRKPDSPDKTLKELFYLINSKLNVNIAIIEVILYAAMNYGPDDYRLARNSPHPVLGIATDTISNRSVSAKLLLQGQQNSLVDYNSFYKGTKPDSIFDVYFKPKEVIEDYKKKFKENTHW